MYILIRHLPALVIGALLGAFIVLGTSVLAEKDANLSIPFEELRTFTEVFYKIKTDYVEEVGDKNLLENAIQGMLTGLDPHSGYLTPDAYQELSISTGGEFGGLGIEVGMEDGFIKVIAPIDDTPAQRAGIKSGDLIIRLDDTPIKGMNLNDAVKLMRGKPGTPIKLTVVREKEEKPLTIEIIRDIIQIKSVKYQTLEPGYGYIRVSHFQAHTTDDLRKATETFKKENSQLKGLILDLRNNPGGVLQAAVGVSDAFLKEGLIVYTEGRVEDSSLKFSAKPDDWVDGAPMVVLVNNGSASASEIVAGALQDHKRAIIMGNKTFGKGSVQTIIAMANNSALKLTTARYYTPLGRSIQAQGIQPDITLKKVEIASVEHEEELDLKESDLSGHLDNPTQSKSTSPEETTETAPPKTPPKPVTEPSTPAKTEEPLSKEEPLIKRDYALYEALNLLKGLDIVRKNPS